ncbi:MAG: HD-GYP domain-containing protein [Fimbriimonas sp.]
MAADNDRSLRYKLLLVLGVAFATMGNVAIIAVNMLVMHREARGATLIGGSVVIGVVLLVFGLLLAFLVTSFILPTSVIQNLQKTFPTTKRLLSGSFLEMLFVAIIALVVVSAAVGMVMQNDAEATAILSLKRVRYLEVVRTQAANAISAGGVDAAGAAHLTSVARSAQLAWPATGGTISMDDLLSLVKLSEAELNREAESFEALEGAIARKNQGLLTVFGLALFVSLGAIVLLRMTRRQEGELLEAREEMARQQAAYQQIADNLPIGFYTYSDGDVETSNAAWDKLVNRVDSESRWEAFTRSLHPEDKERVVETFAKAETEKRAFGLAYRLLSVDGQAKHVETRGVWVEAQGSEPEHIVGFLVDISSRVRAQRLLEDKNKEVLASNDMLRGALAEIESNFEAMVHSLVKAVEAKDPYTAGHSERVMEYSLNIGRRMGLDDDELRVLKMGTLVHDIGKIGIPDAILTKPSRLTDEEYDLIKQHPLLGYRMIEHIPTFSECLPIVLHHHERLDGEGYPHGLKGLEIPLLVRISTVADCFDAMTSDRAYRKGLDPRVAVEELFLSADRKVVDRHIVGVLAEMVEEEGIIYSGTADATAA